MSPRFLTGLILGLVALAGIVTFWVRSLPEFEKPDPDQEISVGAGETLFWSRGRCHLCHKIGDRGYALRGPNLGSSASEPAIGARAGSRAAIQGLASSVDYLMQSLAQPGAFVVPGYRDEMPEAFKAPIGLGPADIQALVLYLNSLGGDSLATIPSLPQGLLAYYSQPPETGGSITGDIVRGRKLFFDDTLAGCATCHRAVDENGKVRGESTGPDLSAVGGFRTAEQIYQKIIHPDSNLVSGYDQVILELRSGVSIAGLLHRETPDSLTLVDGTGRKHSYSLTDVISRAPHPTSIMPGNYADLLTTEDIEDLAAYLASLKSETLRGF